MKKVLNKDNCKRILIVRLSAIGDVVMTTPVAKALRTAFPDAYIAWAVEDRSKDMLEGNPYLDEIIVWKKPGRGSGLSLTQSIGDFRRALRAGRFDTAIDFQGLLKSAAAGWLSGARRRIGCDSAREGANLLYNVRLRMRKDGLRGSDLYGEILELMGVPPGDMEMCVPLSDEERAFARGFIAERLHTHPGSTMVAALCPGTTWKNKFWTDAGWAEVADRLTSDHGVLPIFLGSKADAEMMERITSLMTTQAVSAIGGTTLKQAAAIIEQSDLTVAVDTGLLHIANALKKPIVGIFGPTTWGYLGKKDSLEIVAKELSCMPCYRHPSCEQFDCMQAVTAEDVLSAVSRLAGRVTAR